MGATRGFSFALLRTGSSGRAASRSRVVVFGVLCILFGLGALAGLFGIAVVVEWFVTGPDRIHRLHNIGFGAITGVIVAPAFLVQLFHPDRKLAPLQQVFAVAVAAAVAGVLANDVGYLLLTAILAVAGGITLALHPARDRFLRVHRGISPALAVLTAAAAVPLIGYALGQASLQRNLPADNPHVHMHHFTGMAFMAITLVMCGAVSALRTRGFRLAAWTTGLAGVVFGVASAVFRHAESSPARRWGAVAVLGGVLFILAAEWDHRRLARA